MDARERDYSWYRFDERRSLIIIPEGNDDGTDFEIPAKYEVCDLCGGKGSHVNPSIDSHGLTREDFDEDPDFAHDYFHGRYDVPCAECHGKRVAPIVDEEHATPEQLKRWYEELDHRYQMERERESEMRYGY